MDITRPGRWTLLEKKEYDALFNLIDQMIETSEPNRAEYFRGYRWGLRFYVHGTLEIPSQEHSQLLDGAFEPSGDSRLDAYSKGYRDGCRGLKPEHTA
jgi:hypothetical protein